jgi:hypothetical protein
MVQGSSIEPVASGVRQLWERRKETEHLGPRSTDSGVTGYHSALARARMTSLIESARDAVERIRTDQADVDPRALFRGTWTVSLAAGFLEAVAMLDPSLAGEMFEAFASVGVLVERLRIAGQDAGVGAQISELPAAGGRSRRKRKYIRRVTVRRVLPDRRVRARRQLADRRAASG